MTAVALITGHVNPENAGSADADVILLTSDAFGSNQLVSYMLTLAVVHYLHSPQ
jgi:hypothetical protein